MQDDASLTWQDALSRLKQGNRAYIQAARNSADISLSLRAEASKGGQHPFAVIVSCSDSRVVPEHLFMVGIGELFVIRSAGNIIDDIQRGSAAYAVSQVGAKLVVVLGHTQCGAVAAAIEGAASGSIAAVTGPIASAIHGETDSLRACVLNVENSMAQLRCAPEIAAAEARGDIAVAGAVYRIDTGRVDFL